MCDPPRESYHLRPNQVYPVNPELTRTPNDCTARRNTVGKMYSLLAVWGIPYKTDPMLTKQQFLAKHARKYSKLSTAEKNSRYESYRRSATSGSAPTKQKTAFTPRMSSPKISFMGALCGCSTDSPPLDSSPVLPVTHNTTFSITLDANGAGACLVFPGRYGSSEPWIYNAATIVSGVVTNFGSGVTATSPVSGLLNGRALGVSLRPMYTGAQLNAKGYWSAGIFMPGESSGSWPTTNAAAIQCPQMATGTALDQVPCIIPPPSCDILKMFNEFGNSVNLTKFTNTPAYFYMFNGGVPSDLVRFDLDLSVELSSASTSSTSRVLLTVKPAVPGSDTKLSEEIFRTAANAFGRVITDPRVVNLGMQAVGSAYRSWRPNGRSGPRAIDYDRL